MTMAPAKPKGKRTPAKASFVGRFWGVIKSQWLASALIIPLIILGFQTYIARQDAREARVQSVNVDRISKVQESGKALDLDLAAYFQSVSELGLAERRLRMPGAYAEKPIKLAQADVLKSRLEARAALAKHGADIQSMRGTFDTQTSTQYMSELANVSDLVERDADLNNTGKFVTALSRLVVKRNALIDKAMNKIG